MECAGYSTLPMYKVVYYTKDLGDLRTALFEDPRAAELFVTAMNAIQLPANLLENTHEVLIKGTA